MCCVVAEENISGTVHQDQMTTIAHRPSAILSTFHMDFSNGISASYQNPYQSDASTTQNVNRSSGNRWQQARSPTSRHPYFSPSRSPSQWRSTQQHLWSTREDRSGSEFIITASHDFGRRLNRKDLTRDWSCPMEGCQRRYEEWRRYCFAVLNKNTLIVLDKGVAGVRPTSW